MHIYLIYDGELRKMRNKCGCGSTSLDITVFLEENYTHTGGIICFNLFSFFKLFYSNLIMQQKIKNLYKVQRTVFKSLQYTVHDVQHFYNLPSKGMYAYTMLVFVDSA